MALPLLYKEPPAFHPASGLWVNRYLTICLRAFLNGRISHHQSDTDWPFIA
jgi:hypothetical protein